MALDNQFGKGIGVAAGFDLGAQKPLDARVAVNTLAERDAHVTNNRAYEGMLVYVAEENMTFQLVKGEEEGQLVWKEFGFNQNDFDESFNSSIQDVDDRLKAVEEDLAQGGEIEARIAQNEADIDGLQGLVGKPVEGEEPATGLHLALDNAKAELEQDILDEKGRAEEQERLIRQELADEAAEIRGEMAAELGNYTVEAGEGVEGKEASGLRKEIEDAHKAMDQAMVDMKAELQDEIDDDVEVEKLRAEGQEAAIRQEMATEAKRVDKKIADDIAAESALRVAEEGKLDAAIKAEATEARKQEGLLQDAIDAEAEAARAAEQALGKRIDDEVTARQNADSALDGRLQAVETSIGNGGNLEKRVKQAENDIDALEEKTGVKAEYNAEGTQTVKATGMYEYIDEQDAKLRNEIGNAYSGAEGLVANEKSRAEGEEAAIREELAQVKSDLQKEIDDDVKAEADLRVAADNAINAEIANMKDATKNGSLAKQIADEAAARQQADSGLDQRLQTVEGSVGTGGALEARVKANEDAIGVINGEGEGSIKKAVADLVDGAPQDLDTLKELSAALRDNKDVLTAIETAFDNKLKDVQDDVDQNEADCDAAIKAEKEAREAKEAEVAQAMATEQARVNKKISDDIAAESALRVAEEQRIEKALTDEAAAIRVEMAEQHQAMNKAAEEAHQAINKAMEDEAARVNKKIADDIDAESKLRVAEEARIEGLVTAEASRADAEEKRIVGLVEAEQGRAEGKEGELLAAINKEIEDRGTAVNAEKERAEGQESAIRQELADAIAKEVEDRNAAIKVEADRANAAEEALGARIDSIFAAYDGDQNWPDIVPKA